MSTITIEVKKADPALKKLLLRVRKGEEVIFTQDDKLVARLIPAGKRLAGLHEGKVILSHDFDEPLPDAFWTGEVP